MDIDAYLRRIGWTGAVDPTPETLSALVARHVASIPFENLNPFLGLPVDLDPVALEEKLVRNRRGGYCFEQNALFALALEALGFRASGLAARVLWNGPEDAITPRSHMLLRVELEGRTHLADVGFGGNTPTGPLLLEEGMEQETPHEPYRLIPHDGDWRLHARIGKEWKALYRFDLQRQYPVDYAAANYFLSTSPSSHFVTGLVAARAVEGRRLALRGRDFATHHMDGRTERRRLESADEIIETLDRDFLITPPPVADLRARLDSIA
ncbi:arylamine N-acetyltransferase [Inquilinus sp. CAU 1745]|uniref:arylamine N-acetyltransferase family protein n=1 Tax=Inquilinus sp. CAU 1745 TaxID=3140369 RepID=UPI00325C0221